MSLPKRDGFLNVDLEVGASSRAKLAPMIDALEGTLFELYLGRIGRSYRAHYELSGCGKSDASATIHALAATIEALGPAARLAWRGATVRDFNIGVELERGVKMIELAIDPKAMARVVALGGRIVFTAYQVAAMSSTPERT
jgi:hypothetical protein